jgi:hypothetical protein
MASSSLILMYLIPFNESPNYQMRLGCSSVRSASGARGAFAHVSHKPMRPFTKFCLFTFISGKRRAIEATAQ